MRCPKNVRNVCAKHIEYWLNVQSRIYGERALAGDQYHTPIDTFLADVYGIHATFLSGGEIAMGNTIVTSDFRSIGIEMRNGNGRLHTRLKAWKYLLTLEAQNTRLFA